jgi:shikimate kinase/3-dehydroquinate synthase
LALVLIGFMGAGKSSLARRLAEARGVAPLDSDALLAERFGHSIAAEFAASGEASFRAAESSLVCDLLGDAGPRDVIALGGGAVLSPAVRSALSGHLTALLEVDPALAWSRVGGVGAGKESAGAAGAGEESAGAAGAGSERPLARDRDAFFALHRERSPLYEEVADAVVLWASSTSGGSCTGYPVFVGRGLLNENPLAALWPLDRDRSRPFCVTDEAVGPVYAGRLGPLAGLIAIPPGEPAKTIAVAERVWRELAAAGMTRADHIVALGGGVVGDLAGFCAATYQRGVPVVQVPTTLVAQVDSAYGGKTGVDLPAAKNYVGVYHPPAAVVVDPDVLLTLPPAESHAGWVEVLKTALLAGGGLWEHVAADLPVDERTIIECARLKIAVVSEDERDSGRRQILNLGHTVGHAIETATAYSRYRHGEAVGLGLLAALRLSGLPDLRALVRDLLLAHDLPVSLSGVSVGVEEVVSAVSHDKKRVGSFTPFVLLSAPGDVRIGCEVPDSELRSAVAELT